MVLRVQQMRVCVPFGQPHEFGGRGGDAGEMAEQVERSAFGRKHGARVAGDGHQLGLGRDAIAVAGARLDLDVGREPAERRRDQRQARDRAGLARDHDGAGRRAGGNGRDRGHVAGAAEILGERALDRGVDLERRQEAFGVEQGGRRRRLRQTLQHGASLNARLLDLL